MFIDQELTVGLSLARDIAEKETSQQQERRKFKDHGVEPEQLPFADAQQNCNERSDMQAEQKCCEKPKPLLAEESATIVDEESKHECGVQNKSAPANEVTGDDSDRR
jgi:hypothetical protein